MENKFLNRFLFGTIFCVLALNVSAQILTKDQEAKLADAQATANRFAERFRKTLDFSVVWNEFRVRDDSCAVEGIPTLLGSFTDEQLKEKTFSDRLKAAKLDPALLRTYYSSMWNTSFLFSAVIYSLAPSKSGSEPDIDKVIRGKNAKLFAEVQPIEESEEDYYVRTNKDLETGILRLNKLASRLKKILPKDAMNNDNWKSAMDWANDVRNVKQIKFKEPNSGFCNESREPRYIAQIGLFALEFVEEDGQLRILTLSPVFN